MTFQARRSALKYMIDEKYPEKEIEEMRRYLKYEGWQSDPNLPLKWFHKPRKGRDYHLSFVSAKGIYYRSKESVKASKDVEQEDKIKIENFKKAPEGVISCRTQNLDKW